MITENIQQHIIDREMSTKYSLIMLINISLIYAMIAIKHDCEIHLYLPDPFGEVIYIGLGIRFLKSLSGPEESYCKKYHVLIPIFPSA